MTENKHLWEISHPYFGPTQCYYANGMQAMNDNQHFASWSDFAQPSGVGSGKFNGNPLYDFDDDLNFLYRWDWRRADPDDYYLHPGDPDDETERYEEALERDTLQLFFLLQRKGKMVYAEVRVSEADEPAVREWLTKKAAYMAAMWEPFLAVTPRTEHP